MKPLQKTLARLLQSGILVLGLASLQTTGTGQTLVEGLRFNMYKAEGRAVMASAWMFDWATFDILLPVGQGTYRYQYGTNAIFFGTIAQWERLGTGGTASLPYSFVGTNRWEIDVAGNLVGTPWDYSSWLMLSNGVQIADFPDSTPDFPAWTNRKAKGTIPSLSLTNIDCKLDLVILGDRSDFTNDVIVKFTISATNADTGVRIPDSDITISTKPVTNGVAWKKFQEWNTPDVTPVITGHDNYTFDLQAEIARPTIMFNTANVTGQALTNWAIFTNRIYVGEVIMFLLQLGSWDNQVTNILWSVPGLPVKGFCQDTVTSGPPVPFLYGGPIPFQFVDDCTWLTMWCYMTESITNALFTVSASIMGETFSTWVRLTVNQPPVAYDFGGTNAIAADGNYTGLDFSLHFGLHDPYDDGGIKFRNTIVDDATQGTYSFLQVMESALIEKHLVTNANLAQFYLDITNRAIDGGIPIWLEETLPGPPPEVRIYDSPCTAGQVTDEYHSYDAHWSTYIMWQSNRGPSIPITRWKLTWRYKADAIQCGGWVVNPTSVGEVVTSEETNEMPWWIANVQELLARPWIQRP